MKGSLRGAFFLRMRMKKILFAITSTFICGCSTSSYDPPKRGYLEDNVSVRTVLLQAHAAYIRGCIIAHQEHQKKKVFSQCKDLADKYIETDILNVMDQ
jgi:hypothetical protein